MDFLSSAIIGHLVGDYIVQNHWMAINKKKSLLICTIHCLLYTTAVYMATLAVLPLWAVLVIFATHMIQDHTNLVPWLMDNVYGQKGFRKALAPWSIIVVDNVMHLVVLWAVALVLSSAIG